MAGDMGRRGVKVTGRQRVDTATAEIAGLVRDARIGSHVRYTEQDHYDEAMRLRDEIMAGTLAPEPALLPASASPVLITDDIAINMAATALEAMGHAEVAAGLRYLLPQAEGNVQGEPYQEKTGKWGPLPSADQPRIEPD